MGESVEEASHDRLENRRRCGWERSRMGCAGRGIWAMAAAAATNEGEGGEEKLRLAS